MLKIFSLFAFFLLCVFSSDVKSEGECRLTEEGTCDPRYNCKDNYKKCGEWAKNGECDYNPNFMKFQCAFSCGT